MFDWIEKLPDSVTGFALAGLVWFGFNYAFLAPRAAAQDHAPHHMARCAEAIEARLALPGVNMPRIGTALGVPQLDQFGKQMLESMRPQSLSVAEKQQRCACARNRAAEKLRFDYAVHTASFRIISPQSVSAFGDDTISMVLTGVCGFIPSWKKE